MEGKVLVYTEDVVQESGERFGGSNPMGRIGAAGGKMAGERTY